MGVFIFGLIFLAVSIVALFLWLGNRGSLRTAIAARADMKLPDGTRNNPYADQMSPTKGEIQNLRTRNLIYLGAFLGFALLGVLMTTSQMYVVVPARNVGVVNVFGNADAALSNGFHLKAPWADVENVDTTNKPIQLNDDGNVANGCTSIAVRLASQQIACQDVFVQWQIDPHGDANDLWKTYRGSNDELIANIQNNVVLPRLRSEMQKAFSTYDPLAVLQGGQLQDTTSLQAPVEAALRADMPTGVLILDLRFSQIHYGATTQNKIDAFAQSLADTKIAVQQEQTATAQAAANKILAADPGTSNPGVQYQNCLNLMKDLASKGQLQDAPQSFNCSQGGGTPIILNAGAAK